MDEMRSCSIVYSALVRGLRVRVRVRVRVVSRRVRGSRCVRERPLRTRRLLRQCVATGAVAPAVRSAECILWAQERGASRKNWLAVQ